MPEFSDETKIKRKIALDLIGHPVTFWSVPVGLTGMIAMLIDPSLIGLVLLTGGFGISMGSYIINYFFRGEVFEERYRQKFYERVIKEQKKSLEELEGDLRNFAKIKGAEEHVAQAEEQLSLVQKKLAALYSILKGKFNKGELTYVRYADIIEQGCGAVLDNIKYIVALVKSISTIDESYINARFKELSKSKTQSEADKKEIVTLSNRKIIREEQLNKINEVLTQNEELFTKIDEASVEIADLRLEKGSAMADAEAVFLELEKLVERIRSQRTAVNIKI